MKEHQHTTIIPDKANLYILLSALFFFVLFSAVFITWNSENPEDLKIREAVEGELRLHPEARLTDIYKFFFQDEFGPGHMIPSRKAAMSYLDFELSSSTSFEE